jgi:hypothetical protein
MGPPYPLPFVHSQDLHRVRVEQRNEGTKLFLFAFKWSRGTVILYCPHLNRELSKILGVL